MPILDLKDIVIYESPGGPTYAVPNASMRAMEAIVNATWDLAGTKSSSMSTKFNNAQGTYLDTAPTVSAGSVTAPTLTAPDVAIPEQIDAADVTVVFNTQMNALVTKFGEFRTTYFPDESAAYTAAENWLQAAIANDNGGIPVAVQEQLYEDDRSRILEDASRASDAVIGAFAARGYPLPPGAAAAAAIEIQRKAQGEIASSSRKLSALAIDMQKFNVQQLLSLRQVAMSSALDYIKSIAASSAQVTGLGYDSQSKLIASAADFYRAQTGAAELVAKVGQFNQTLALDAGAKNQAAELNLINAKLQAMLEEAKSVAAMATSLYNNLNVSTSIRADGGTSVTTSP